MDICFNCHRPGHWAKDCDKQPCPRCGTALDWHTEAGLTECAWRGPRCSGCEHPPHPDRGYGPCSIPGCAPEHSRCARYSHPSDTQAARDIRFRTAWCRDADLDTFYCKPGQLV